MILATVKLNQPIPGIKFIDISPINKWLLDIVGPNAKFRDLVDENRPWHADHGFYHIEYSFAREEDATLFSLRWS